MILKGWKDIAKYLGCGLRTAQRWESLGLPVRRPAHQLRSAVVALTKDIDAWVRSESGQVTVTQSSKQTADLSRFQHRILVADADEKLLITLSTLLSREGYEVRTALDGFEALAVMRDSLPDLLISALQMPNMSGFELLSVMRRRFPGVSVIAFSSEFTSAMDVLCDQYVEKGPNSRTKLVAAVRGLLARSPLRAQPAKSDVLTLWLSRPINGYVVLTCHNCLRSFSLITRSAVVGKDAATACDYCGAEVKYHIYDSDLPIADDLKKINQILIPTTPERIRELTGKERMFLGSTAKKSV